MTLIELMKVVSLHLDGWHWEEEQNSQRWHFVHLTSGARVSAYPCSNWGDEQRRRVEFFPCWPQGAGHYYEPNASDCKSHKISISAARHPQVIAKDLARRLLTSLPGEYVEQLGRMARFLNEKEDAAKLAGSLATSMGVKVWGQRDDRNRFSVNADSLNLLARVELSGCIHFERLTLSKALAIKTFAFWAEQLQMDGGL